MTHPFTAIATTTTSAGSADAGKVPLLDANGVLDPTLLNTTTTTTGSADASKIPELNAAGVLDVSLFKGVTSSAGSANAGDVPVLNSEGQIDSSFLAAVTGGGGAATYLDVGGWRFVQGSGTIAGQSGNRYANGSATFPLVGGAAPFNNIPTVIAQVATNLGGGARGDNPILIVNGVTGSGFNVNINTNDSNDSQTFPTVDFTYLAVGTHA